MGLGGNCILQGGLGPTGKSRYPRDLFQQEGVKYIILFEGVNDLGGRGDAISKANQIQEVYKQIIAEAHERGITVQAVTLTVSSILMPQWATPTIPHNSIPSTSLRMTTCTPMLTVTFRWVTASTSSCLRNKQEKV